MSNSKPKMQNSFIIFKENQVIFQQRLFLVTNLATVAYLNFVLLECEPVLIVLRSIALLIKRF